MVLQWGREKRAGYYADVKKCRGEDAAQELIKRKGAQILIEVAKCHFKTTDAVLSATGFSRKDLPEEGQVTSKETTGWDFRKSIP